MKLDESVLYDIIITDQNKEVLSAENEGNYKIGRLFNHKLRHIMYNRGMLMAYTDRGVYCTKNLVVDDAKIPVEDSQYNNIPNVYYTKAAYMLHCASANYNDVAILTGKHYLMAEAALDLQQYFKQVYLITDKYEFKAKRAVMTKLKKAHNVHILTGCKIANYTADENGLRSILLDTFSTIDTRGLYVLTDPEPDLSYIPANMLDRDENDYAITDELGRSLKCSNLWVTQSCGKNEKSLTDIMKSICPDIV